MKDSTSIYMPINLFAILFIKLMAKKYPYYNRL